MKLSFTAAVVSAVLVVANLTNLSFAQSAIALCNCGLGTESQFYNAAQLQSAVSAAKVARPTSTRDYPHKFSNYEGIILNPLCSGIPKPTMTEFPVLPSATFTSGAQPGPDRVIYASNGQFCGCVTHRGAAGGKFKPCVYTI